MINGPLVVDNGISDVVVVVLESPLPVMVVVVAVVGVVEPPGGTGVTGTAVVGAGVAGTKSTVVVPTPTRSREPVPDELMSKRNTMLVLGDMSVTGLSILSDVNCVALPPMVMSG